MGHPIENIMKTTMENLKAMADVNTIIGDPIITSGQSMVLPVSKVSMGFLSGGGEYGASKLKKAGVQLDEEEGRYPFAGMSAAGMSLTPLAFLSVNGDCVKVLPAQYKDPAERAIAIIPESLCALERILKEKCHCQSEHKCENKYPSDEPVIGGADGNTDAC